MQEKKIEPIRHYLGVFSTKCREGEYAAILEVIERKLYSNP